MTASNAKGSRPFRALRTWGARLAIATTAASAIAEPVLGEDASPTAGMSRGWDFAEQGGADLFDNVCAACHQPDAKGAVGAAAYPPLASDRKLASADFILTVLFSGQGGMPPLGRMMSDEQVADVVNYVRTHFGNNYVAEVSAAQASAARRRAETPP
jgi:mono/diheme cytochrome c family protein